MMRLVSTAVFQYSLQPIFSNFWLLSSAGSEGNISIKTDLKKINKSKNWQAAYRVKVHFTDKTQSKHCICRNDNHNNNNNQRKIKEHC